MKVQGMKWLGLFVLLAAGFLMVAPSAFAASDGGYSATCKDGTSWTGTSKRGACRGHKGVKGWTSEGAASGAATESGSMATHERKSKGSKKSEEAAPAAAGAPAAAPAAAPGNNMAASPAAAPRRDTHTASTGGSMGSPAPGGGAGKVWVNTESKTYHCQGTKWYGTTKHGEYMTEAQAKSQGYHADHGKACSG